MSENPAENMYPTLNDLLNSSQSLVRLANLNLPSKVAYRLSKIMKFVGRELEHLDAARSKIIKKYGKLNEDGQFQIAKEDKEAFDAYAKDYQPLLEETVRIPMRKLPLSDFGTAQIATSDLIALSWLIHDPDSDSEFAELENMMKPKVNNDEEENKPQA
jgi:hypothetical protein